MQRKSSHKTSPAAWWNSYKTYAVVWYGLGLYALYLQQPLGFAGCMMTVILSMKLSRWERMI